MTGNDQKINGKNLLHVKEYIKYKWGIEGLELFETNCQVDLSNIYEDKFYPFNVYIETLESVKSIFSEEEEVAYKIGWHRARHMVLIQGKSKKGLDILEKIATAWNKFNTFGDISIEKENDNEATVTISNYNAHPLYCERTRGFFAGLMSAVLSDPSSVEEVKCIRQGHDACQYRINVK